MTRRTHNLTREGGDNERPPPVTTRPQLNKLFLFSSFPQQTKNKTVVKLTAVSCAPVVEVKIKRPDTKYQLGFSVQNGVVSRQ